MLNCLSVYLWPLYCSTKVSLQKAIFVRIRKAS